MKLNCLAEKLGAVLEGSGDVEITGVAGLNEANEGHITFVTENKFTQLEQTRASAAIVPLNAPKLRKIPQVGGVIIGEDVEIGANSTIDRATLGNTVIKRGTKIDNLVHVAHNVTIREHCFLIAQVGIAGSCTLGNYVVLAGQVGLADHVSIGDRTALRCLRIRSVFSQFLHLISEIGRLFFQFRQFWDNCLDLEPLSLRHGVIPAHQTAGQKTEKENKKGEVIVW